MSKSSSFNLKVYETVKKIPSGKVATYGQVACLCGNPKASRAVRWALHLNPEPVVIPCHRVVNRMGGLAPEFAFGGAEIQAQMLISEGVEVNGLKVDLNKFIWKPIE